MLCFAACRYVGTANLARDIDRLRRAIGADKLGCYGGSYGTGVCPAYAAAFPSHTDKVVLNGNVASEGSTAAYYRSVAEATRNTLTKLMSRTAGQGDGTGTVGDRVGPPNIGL